MLVNETTDSTGKRQERKKERQADVFLFCFVCRKKKFGTRGSMQNGSFTFLHSSQPAHRGCMCKRALVNPYKTVFGFFMGVPARATEGNG